MLFRSRSHDLVLLSLPLSSSLAETLRLSMAVLELVTTLSLSLGGGALFAVRALRHLQHGDSSVLARCVTLLAACAPDIALVLFLYAIAASVMRFISADRARRRYSGDIEESAALLKLRNCEKRNRTPATTEMRNERMSNHSGLREPSMTSLRHRGRYSRRSMPDLRSVSSKSSASWTFLDRKSNV